MIWLFANRGFGDPFVAAAARCATRGVEVTLVYSTRSDAGRPFVRRAGSRGRHVWWRIDTRIRRPSLRLLLVDDVNTASFVARLRSDDLGIVCGFDQIFRAATIARLRSMVNIHPSVLPLYRGPAPSYWCLANGEQVSGFTLHDLTEDVDAGPVIYQDTVEVAGCRSASALDARIARAAVPVFIEYVERATRGASLERRPLDANRIYHVPQRYAPHPRAARRGERPVRP